MDDVGGSTGSRERSSRLQAGVADFVARTKGRVAFQGDERAVVITGRPVNHILHLLLTLVTGGLWAIVWIFAAASGGEESHILTVDDTGAVLIQGERTVSTGSWRLPRVVGLAVIILALLLYPVGARGPLLVLGWIVLAGSGVALIVTDIRKFGTGKTVAAIDVSRALVSLETTQLRTRAECAASCCRNPSLLSRHVGLGERPLCRPGSAER